jgi:hypothetical protein
MRRWQVRPTRVLAVLAVGAAAVRAGQLSPGKDVVVRSVQIERAPEYWRQQGFVDIVAPIRPPTSSDGSARIVVYVKLPEGAEIATERGPHGEIWLRYPVGTVTDRVEYFGARDDDSAPGPGWRVADVRGTELLEGASERFHVYRPSRDAPGVPLLGLSWPRGDERARALATERLGRLLEAGEVAGPATEGARNEAAARLRSINDCAGCHQPRQAPRRRPGLVNRGTDASGFFHLSTALFDRAPLETYRARNPNLRDPYVRFVCGERELPAQPDPQQPGGVRCPEGDVPVGVLDVVASRRAATPHAARLCASRRFLYDRLDERGRGLFRAAIETCEGGAEPRPETP